MSSKSTADLTTQNDDNINNQTSPESIFPTLLGSDLQDIIDSMYNRIDDALTPAPIQLTKAQLLTAITNSTLTDKQWIQITDRADGFPLFVTSQGVNNISPFGIWVNAAKPLAVIMDYVNGFEGETLPFYAYIDGTGIFTTATPIKIADGTEADGYVLTSNASGQSSWKGVANSQMQVNSIAAMTGASALMMGLAGAITPAKTGKVLIVISGEFISDDIADETVLVLKTGTGTAPANGDASTGTTQQTTLRVASSTTDRIPFTINQIVTLTPLTAYWIDLAVKNNSSTSVQLFNISISALEQ